MNQKLSSKELVNKIISDEKLHPGDKVSYDRLIELSNKYNITPYTMATNVLGVSQAQFQAINSKSSNAKNFIILKHEIPEMIEKAISARDKIIKEEHLEVGSFINYAQLQKISEKYDIPEKVLAINVLQIAEYSYRKIKYYPEARAIVFYEQKYLDSRKEKIDEDTLNKRKEILSNENIRIGDKISYETLMQISKKYGIDEKQLAFEIFGITKNAFYHLKSDSSRKAIILKGTLKDDSFKNLTKKIIEEEEIQPYSLLDYTELKSISEKYLVNEKIIALNVLGLSETQYWNMKYNSKTKAYVLKSEYKAPNYKELQSLKNKIFESERISVGTKISYERINDLQGKYNVSLKELLYILGVTRYAYNFIKSNHKYNSIVKDTNTYSVCQLISETIEKERYYSKEEIGQICEINNISRQDFFDYILGGGVYFRRDDYEKVLQKKRKIWIGAKTKLSDKFLEENLDKIRQIAKKASKNIYYKYKSKTRRIEQEDLEQEACIVIIQTCGDLEKNFEGDELTRMIYLRARTNILMRISKPEKTVSVSGYYGNAGNKSFKEKDNNDDLEIKDINTNIENEVLRKIENEEMSIMGYLSVLVEQGFDRESCLNKTAEVFGIDKKTMLEVLEKELIENGKVKKVGEDVYIYGE